MRYLTFANNRRELATAIAASAGTADADKIARLGSAGQYDPSLLPPALDYENLLLNSSFRLSRSNQPINRTPAPLWSFTAGNGLATTSIGSFSWNQTDVPGFPRNFLQYSIAAAPTATRGTIGQALEGVGTCAGQTITLAWWMWSSVSWSAQFQAVQNFGSGGTPTASVITSGSSFTIAANTWQRYSSTLTIPNLPGGATLGTDGNDHLLLQLTPALNQTGNIRIANAGCYRGSIAPPYREIPVAVERQLCSRYWQRTTCILEGDFSAPGTYAAFGSLLPMRATPTIAGTNLSNLNFPASVNFGFLNLGGEFWVQDVRSTTAAGRGRIISSAECSAEL